MTNIIIYGIDNNYGGIENYIFTLISKINLDRENIHFHILTEYSDFAFKDELTKQYHCTFAILPNKYKHPIKYSKTIKTEIENFGNDAKIHLNLMSYRNIFLLHSIKKLKNKILITSHSVKTKNLLHNIQHTINKLVYKKLGDKYAVSLDAGKFMFGRSKFQIIPTGIEESKYEFNQELRTKYRKQFHIDDDIFAVGQVGRISYEKNQIFSAKVFSDLKEKNIHLYFFGNESDKKIAQKIKKYNYSNIHFCGQNAKMNEIYNCLDLFILPSKFESTGLAFYEAISNGLPSIISNKVPSIGIDNSYILQVELKRKIWCESIKKLSKTNIKRIESRDNTLPSIKKQINFYRKIYEN